MAYEIIELIAGGKKYVGWTACTVKASGTEVARTARIIVTELGDADWNFPPFTEVELLASGSQLLKGYVQDYQPSYSADQHEVALTLVSDSIDYADNSVKSETGFFENKTVSEIAEELGKPFGLGIVVSPQAVSAAGEVIEWFQLRLGAATPWSEMMRLLPQRGLTMRGRADGKAEITKEGDEMHAGGLIEGWNIIAATGLMTSRELFAETSAVGQGDETEDEDYEPEGVAFDERVTRERYKQVVVEEAADQKLLQKRAEHEKARAAGFSAQATIVTPGFRDAGGTLWEPYRGIYVQSPKLKLWRNMIIQEVTFSQDPDGGTVSTLSLHAPGTGGGEASPEGEGDPFYFFRPGPGEKPAPRRNRGEE
jgi:prophage tail gpP-like protein